MRTFSFYYTWLNSKRTSNWGATLGKIVQFSDVKNNPILSDYLEWNEILYKFLKFESTSFQEWPISNFVQILS